MPAREQKTAVGTSGGYDQSLIAKAPEITKLDRQEGYDINLVEQGRRTPHPPSSAPRTRNTPPTPAPAPLTSGSQSSVEKIPRVAANGYSKDVTASKSTPWYRTTKGLAIIVVVAFALVGVIVGVAVGVTQSKKNNSVQKPASTGGGVQSGGVEPSAATPTSIAASSVRGGVGSNPTSSNGNVAISSGIPGAPN